MNDYILLCIMILQVVFSLVLLIMLIKISKNKGNAQDNSELRYQIREDAKADAAILRQELASTTQASIKNMGEIINASQSQNMANLENRFKTFSLENEQKLDNIRKTVSTQLSYIQEDNNKKLDEMRQTVDEKLQKTLESTMQQSFGLVSKRLEEVYKGLGEMQNLATGVGDLKKVLSNVKTRGILGEIQLGAILREILSPEQFDENVVTKSKGAERVEFAVKLPAEDDGFIYLPIDSKFPADTYMALQNAYESGDAAQVEAAAKLLLRTFEKEAKDISEKYIEAPYTTEFAIMFLPTEGLYCEAVNRGMIEVLQSKYKVNLAGPSTMAALLNSLQMGFKTLAVQKRSAEVWKVLGSVKNEFEKFEKVITDTQKRLDQANDELEKLVGVRTRAINRHLKAVESNNIPIESFSANIPLLGEEE
ncbi:MAG: DNA recombination protein RmuC [Clostridia bacterium]|nr:DNA recombination protein RmuC [Clostridia bacterium]